MSNIAVFIAMIPFFPIFLLLWLMICYYDYTSAKESAKKMEERNKRHLKRIQEKAERGECEKPRKITEEEFRKELELLSKLFGDSSGDSISKKSH